MDQSSKPIPRPCSGADFRVVDNAARGMVFSRLDLVTKHGLGGLLAVLVLLVVAPVNAASVKPGDLISPENARSVTDLVSPGNFALVKQGMRMKIAPTDRLEWPPPYKAATEKYSAQVKL